MKLTSSEVLLNKLYSITPKKQGTKVQQHIMKLTDLSFNEDHC